MFRREWGLKGAVRASFYNPQSPLLKNLRAVYVEEAGEWRSVSLRSSPKTYRDEFLIELEAVHSPEAAQAWRNREFYCPEAELASLKPGEFYWFQVIGAAVYDDTGAYWGDCIGLEGLPASLCLAIRDPNGKEILYPAHPDKIRHFDAAQKRLTVERIEGLQ